MPEAMQSMHQDLHVETHVDAHDTQVHDLAAQGIVLATIDEILRYRYGIECGPRCDARAPTNAEIAEWKALGNLLAHQEGGTPARACTMQHANVFIIGE